MSFWDPAWRVAIGQEYWTGQLRQDRVRFGSILIVVSSEAILGCYFCRVVNVSEYWLGCRLLAVRLD